MASKYGRDTATAGLKRDPVSDAILVNLSESAVRNEEATDDDNATRGVARDASGAIIVKVTGLPDSVVSGSVIELGDAIPASGVVFQKGADGGLDNIYIDGVEA